MTPARGCGTAFVFVYFSATFFLVFHPLFFQHFPVPTHSAEVTLRLTYCLLIVASGADSGWSRLRRPKNRWLHHSDAENLGELAFLLAQQLVAGNSIAATVRLSKREGAQTTTVESQVSRRRVPGTIKVVDLQRSAQHR